MNKQRININGINIDIINYSGLLNIIRDSIDRGSQKAIAYVNANSINLSYSKDPSGKFKDLKNSLNGFDIIHPDGIGIYIASKILFGRSGLNERFTGSDLYPLLVNDAIKNKWKVFFLGHDDETLSKINSNLPGLTIAGIQNGYEYDDQELIVKINTAKADILVVGLGTPKQEYWVSKHKNELNSKIILCVGDGIRVFAGNKKRGPEFMRKTGMEWLARFAQNPLKYFKRYILGNPIFLYRIIRVKMRKLA